MKNNLNALLHIKISGLFLDTFSKGHFQIFVNYWYAKASAKHMKNRNQRNQSDGTLASQSFRQLLWNVEVLTVNNYLAEKYIADVSQFFPFC